MPTPIEFALNYARQGFTILPVNPATKAALTKNWTNRADKGEPGSSKDEAVIRQWWTQWPGALVGIRTGEVNGVVCLDVDRHGVSDGFKTLKTLDGVDPTQTATVLTPGNGWHIWYKFPADLASGTMLGAGLDFQARGRMVIAPGCVRAGKEYCYVNGHTLADLAPLPGSILAMLKRSAGQQRLDTWSAKIEATPEGDRHRIVRDACWALAHDVVKGKLDETEFRRRIADMASTCVPALDKLDVDNSIESALRKVRAETGHKDKPDAAPSFTLPDFEPADEPVELAATLDGMVDALLAYVVMDEYQAKTAALWVLHCHCLEATDYTPRLRLTSPMRRCGKSTALRVLSKLVPRPLPLSGVSAALLFRTIGDLRPTIMLDEADNAGLNDNPNLKIVLNEGTWRGAVIGRLVGDGHEPKFFPIFAPVVYAGIGDKVPGPLLDRSIMLRLRRKLVSETRTRFDRRHIDHLTALGRQAARFAMENTAALTEANPIVPDGLNDREMDGWRPLLAIADMAGPRWAEAARAAAMLLAETDEFEDEPALLLLRDCRKVFDDGKCSFEDEITSADLVMKLHALEEPME